MSQNEPEEGGNFTATEVLNLAMTHAAAEALASGGAMVTGIMGIVAFIDSDGDKSWAAFVDDGGGNGLHFFQALGMVDTLHHYVHQGAFTEGAPE